MKWATILILIIGLWASAPAQTLEDYTGQTAAQLSAMTDRVTVPNTAYWNAHAYLQIKLLIDRVLRMYSADSTMAYVTWDKLSAAVQDSILSNPSVSSVVWSDLVTAVQDSITARLLITALTDSLNKYRTAYKLDTTAIDTVQYGKFVRDHQRTVAVDDSTWWSAQVGAGNAVDDSSFAVGENNIASDNSIAIGHDNVARQNGVAIGYNNWVYNHEWPGDNGGSLAVGWADTVTSASCFIAGNENYIRVDAFGDTANSGASGIIGNLNRNYGASALVVGEDNRNGAGAVDDPTIKDQDGTSTFVVGVSNYNRAPYSVVAGAHNNVGIIGESTAFGVIVGGIHSDVLGLETISVGRNLNVNANYSAVFGHNNYQYGDGALMAGVNNYGGGDGWILGNFNKIDSLTLYNHIFGEYNHIKNYRHSFIIGDNDTTDGWYNWAIGRYLKMSSTRSVLIGHGLTDGTVMAMPSNYTFGVGFKSTIPTLVITEAEDTAGSWGRVGIGDNSPDARFEVDNGGILASDSLSVGGGVWVRNLYQSGNDIGIIFYNSALSRVDTVFAKQP